MPKFKKFQITGRNDKERFKDNPKAIEWQKNCYGMTQADMTYCLNDNLSTVFKDTATEAKEWLALCMLSDVQELMARNLTEDARQLVNRVKFLLQQTLTETEAS